MPYSVEVGTHLYCTFFDADKSKLPPQITYEIHSKLSELDSKDGSVDNTTWEEARGIPEDQLVRKIREAHPKPTNTASAAADSGHTAWSGRRVANGALCR